jgi:hypothetical protein
VTDAQPDQSSGSSRSKPAGGRAGKEPTPTFDPMTAMQSLLPGLAWTQEMLEGGARAQAALAAETLKKLNAPVVEALQTQRELATAMANMAEQMAAMASNVEALARQHADVAKAMEAALEPYLRYVDWLEKQGTPPRRQRR